MSKVNSFNKKDLEKKRDQKRKEKLRKKEERKSDSSVKSFDDMIAYVDENGNITNTPPDLDKVKQEIDLSTIMVSTQKKEDTGPEILEGRIEYFNDSKGYGFVKDKNSINKYFFHISSAPQTIKVGEVVNFEIEKGQKGYNAVRLEYLPKPVKNTTPAES